MDPAELSQTTPAVEAPSAPMSVPDPTGTAAPPIVPPAPPAGTLPSDIPVAPPDPAVEADPDAEIPTAAPEGSSEAQQANWAALSASRDRHRSAATEAAARIAELEGQLAAFGPIVDDASKMAQITQLDEIGPEDVFNFETVLYELNQPLYEALVAKAVQRYATHYGYQPPPTGDQPSAAGVPTATPNTATAPTGLPENVVGELGYLDESDPETAAFFKKALDDQRRLAELEAQMRQSSDRHSAETGAAQDEAHDMQFADFICDLFGKYGIARTATVTDPRTGLTSVQGNPVLVPWIQDLLTRVENDPQAGPNLARSRDAFAGKRGNMKAALPGLSAKVRADIGRVFANDFAPRLATLAPPVVPNLTPDELRARAEANPPPSPGGATAPVPGQDKALPKRERIKAIYARFGG